MPMIFTRTNGTTTQYLAFGKRFEQGVQQHFNADGSKEVKTFINRDLEWTTDAKRALVVFNNMGHVMMDQKAVVSEPGYQYQILEFNASPEQQTNETPSTDLEGNEVELKEAPEEETPIVPIPELKDDDLTALICTSAKKYDELKKYNPDYNVESALFVNRELLDQNKLRIKIPIGQARDNGILCATVKGSKVLVLAKKKVQIVAEAV